MTTYGFSYPTAIFDKVTRSDCNTGLPVMVVAIDDCVVLILVLETGLIVIRLTASKQISV